MAQDFILLGVIVEKRKAISPWIDHTWGAIGVMPGMLDVAPMTLLSQQGDVERYYLGAANLVISTAETANYRDNLITGAPKLWVVMQQDPIDATLVLIAVTADPSEGEGYAETGSNLVEPVPMPPEVAAQLAVFVDTHHVEQEFYKRKRVKADKEALGRRSHDDEPGW